MFQECLKENVVYLKKKVDREVRSYHVSRRKIRVFVNSPKDPYNLIPILQIDKLRQKEVKKICPRSLSREVVELEFAPRKSSGRL